MLQYDIDNDPTVHAGYLAGLGLNNIIHALVLDKENLVKEVTRLAGIAPKKYKLPDGKIVIWRCPDDLIPLC